jgi:hypothetical protein
VILSAAEHDAPSRSQVTQFTPVEFIAGADLPGHNPRTID